MDTLEFDIVKLKQLGGINTNSAIRNFASYEQYFSELDKFVNESKYYLRDFIPSEIINQREVRQSFQTEVKKIRARLMSLGITSALSTLMEISSEADGGNEKHLAGWLLKFEYELSNTARHISESRVVSKANLQDEKEGDKPIILAVDDMPELLIPIVDILGDRFKVMATASGKAALRAIDRHSPALFLLDIEMPEMDGYELAKQIRERKEFEQTPIIFLTSKNTREDVMSAIKNGGNDYILKPVTKDLLFSKILKHLGEI